MEHTFELWAPVSGYDEPLQASTLGRVQSLSTRNVMATARSTVTGRTYVRLPRKGHDIWLRLDQIILCSHIGLGRFVSEPFHKDGNLQNNRLSNLEWRQAQRQRVGEEGAALSDHDLYDLWLAGWKASDIARFFNCKEDGVQSTLDKYMAIEQAPELSRAATTIQEGDLPF